jgi:hypothetical protein
MDSEGALRQAADLLSRATIVLLVIGKEFAEDCNSIVALKDIAALNIPGLTAENAFSSDLLQSDSAVFYGTGDFSG